MAKRHLNHGHRRIALMFYRDHSRAHGDDSASKVLILQEWVQIPRTSVKRDLSCSHHGTCNSSRSKMEAGRCLNAHRLVCLDYMAKFQAIETLHQRKHKKYPRSDTQSCPMIYIYTYIQSCPMTYIYIYIIHTWSPYRLICIPVYLPNCSLLTSPHTQGPL